MKLHHVAYQVEDLALTVKWYNEMFGAKENWKMEGGFSDTTLKRLPNIKTLVELQAGEVRWHIFDRGSVVSPLLRPTQQPEYQHVCIGVSQIEELEVFRQKWQELYFNFKEQYQKMATAPAQLCSNIIVEDNGSAEFYCLDPNGLEIEMFYSLPQ